MARFSEEDRTTIWDMREAGVPVKRIARHLAGRPRHYVGSSPMPAANAQGLVSAPSCGSRSKSARKSREAWRQVTRCGQ